MRKLNRMVFLILIVILTAGCTQKQGLKLEQTKTQQTPGVVNNLSNIEKENIKTPELAGGMESAVRTSGHNPNFPKVVFYRGNPSLNQTALTFDDGPDIYFTTRVLDILKSHGVKATFFIVGKRAEAHPDIVKRIINEGHAIGNHTWDHLNLTKGTPERIKDEISRTEQILDSVVGYYPSIFRPPYGSTSPEVIKEVSSMGYYIIDWSVDTRDWAGTPTPKIMEYVKKEFRPGGIILQHCAGGKGEDLTNTLQALPEIISFLKGKEVRFVTIPELLNIPVSKR